MSIPEAPTASSTSELARLQTMPIPELKQCLKLSLARKSSLPLIHVSAGESPADVWIALVEQADTESAFSRRVQQVTANLLHELLSDELLSPWAQQLCHLVGYIFAPDVDDLLRELLVTNKFRRPTFLAGDVDRLLLMAAALRTRSWQRSWLPLLREERYADIAHLALSISATAAMKYIGVAADAIDNDDRCSAFVWITLSQWLDRTSDAGVLRAAIRDYVPHDSRASRHIARWAEYHGLEHELMEANLERLFGDTNISGHQTSALYDMPSTNIASYLSVGADPFVESSESKGHTLTLASASDFGVSKYVGGGVSHYWERREVAWYSPEAITRYATESNIPIHRTSPTKK
jgi:hypothetical protein